MILGSVSPWRMSGKARKLIIPHCSVQRVAVTWHHANRGLECKVFVSEQSQGHETIPQTGKEKNCHPSSWLQDLRQLPHDTVKPLNKPQPLLRSSLTAKRMSLQDGGRTGKASAGTPHSILVVSLGRAVSCFVISLSHGLLNCEG